MRIKAASTDAAASARARMGRVWGGACFCCADSAQAARTDARSAADATDTTTCQSEGGGRSGPVPPSGILAFCVRAEGSGAEEDRRTGNVGREIGRRGCVLSAAVLEGEYEGLPD